MRHARSLCAVIPLLAGPAAAQVHHNPVPQHHGQAQTTPYAGLQSRIIRGLSDQQIADLEAGRGMGLALPAELNGYPGPLHTLELAAPLQLTEPQQRRVQGLLHDMRDEAKAIGQEIIRLEQDLDGFFKAGSPAAERLAELTLAIGAAQGRLRNAHLRYHLATVEVLSPQQITRYRELRGYASAN